jgi:hypothetical protein
LGDNQQIPIGDHKKTTKKVRISKNETPGKEGITFFEVLTTRV